MGGPDQFIKTLSSVQSIAENRHLNCRDTNMSAGPFMGGLLAGAFITSVCSCQIKEQHKQMKHDMQSVLSGSRVYTPPVQPYKLTLGDYLTVDISYKTLHEELLPRWNDAVVRTYKRLAA
eukprot:GDKI01034150.1.p1 GENE.GDKI01034150.1~~GDKI01034150.1.p1  ORF type:complete len:120 (+),score=16.21 GDKI01034150.1:1-360(+)